MESALVLKGRPAAPGRVEAPARVVTASSGPDALVGGEVLVVTDARQLPTEALDRAAALVTDVGSADEALAAEARGRGIPAVLGTGIATRCIRDGMLLDVDGGRGTVTLPEGAAPIPAGFKPRIPYKFAIGAAALVLLAARVARR